MLTIVVNRKSGTARRMGRGALRLRLSEACAKAGIEDPVIRIVHPKRIDGVLREACAAGGEVWVGGGDGTLRTAATRLRESSGTLGVLPLGTMNLLARDLGIPLDLEEAVVALAHAPVEPIDVGLMNGELFLNKSALGLYPEMIIDRERRRRLFGYGKWPAMLRAMWRAIRRHRMMEAVLTVDGQERRITTPAMIVATSEYEFRTGRLFRRPSLRDGLLTVYISHERGWFGTLGQLLKMWLGTIGRDPEMEILRTPRLDIAFKRSRPVANDGEVEFVRGPVHYEVDPSGLKVRHPAAAHPAEAGDQAAEAVAETA
ncbi:diacylglycerol/lipid kinase family protein [Caenispirillum salinarum]|uniref:diacylglycerol/lipid kinase family protein n=1 Tax=Caenispirillum salinarum TaxID=859058 RepID=UPI0038513659